MYNRFYDIETGGCITLDTLEEIWQEDETLQEEYPRFSWYVQACLTRNGGTLEEID